MVSDEMMKAAVVAFVQDGTPIDKSYVNMYAKSSSQSEFKIMKFMAEAVCSPASKKTVKKVK